MSIILIWLGTLFWEISGSLMKIHNKQLNPLQRAFLISLFIVFSSLILIYLFWFKLTFNVTNFLLILYLIAGSIVYYYFILKAVWIADRSTLNIFILLKIPLVLIIDLIIGYQLSNIQIIWILTIFTLIAFINYKENKIYNLNGLKYIIFAIIIWSINISIFKILVENGNNIPSLVIAYSLFSCIFFGIRLFIKWWISNFKFLTNKTFLLIWFVSSLNTLLIAFSYLFLPPSIITTYKNTFSLLRSHISAKVIFNEKYVFKKIIIASFTLFIIVSLL